MSQGGRFNATALERVVFGRPAAEVVPGELERLGRSRACLLVSDSLRTGRSEVSDLEEALGGATVGTYSGCGRTPPARRSSNVRRLPAKAEPTSSLL